MKKYLFLICGICAFAFSGCRSSNDMGSYYDHATTILNWELDGSLTLRAWGEGRNRNDAIEQAKKNAVYEVIFHGIVNTGDAYTSKPIVTEINAREKYQEYFDRFFADGGAYSKYVSMADNRLGSQTSLSNSLQKTYATTVRVLVPQLRQRLQDDGIIK